MFLNKRDDTKHIQDLESLISDHVTGRVVQHEVNQLTQFGENFGSEMVTVDITVDDDGKQHVVHAVGKLIPLTDMQMEIFNTQVTFKNEIGFYSVIVPTLRKFQEDQGINEHELMNYFPKLYGARTSLNENAEDVDKDAIILMENLKISGYENLERHTGFNLDTTKLVLRTFANFQATVAALKQLRPNLFTSKMKPYCEEWKCDLPLLELDKIIAEDPSTSHLTSRLNKLFQRSKLRVKKLREPWATISHNDAWINNIMFKITNDEVEDIKLVDFQIFDHASFACDLIFLLFSSVQIPVLEYHFDKLIRYYYDQFIAQLQRLKANTKPFTFESFQEEIRIEAPFQVYHSLFMLAVVLGPKGMPKMPGKVRQWQPDNSVNSASLTNDSSMTGELNSIHAGPGGPGGPESPKRKGPIFKFSPECKQKIRFVAQEAAKRKWL